MQAILGSCDMLDTVGYSTKNYIPDNTSREVCLLSAQLFCLYLATADNTFKQTEADVINIIIEKTDSVKALVELATKSGAILLDLY